MGDEMGLGKTIQLVCFLGGLHHSGLFQPSLIVAPVTTLKHWQRELRTWHAPFRVFVLHHTARSRSGAQALLFNTTLRTRTDCLASEHQMRFGWVPFSCMCASQLPMRKRC